MNRVRDYSALPSWAVYLGSTDGGSISEALADTLDLAAAPVYFDDETGRHYFETAREVKA